MKIVKEELTFIRHEDPYMNAGVGSEVPIRKWLDKMKIENYKINPDFTIDVHLRSNGRNANVNLDSKGLTELPEYIQFNNIEGSFWISNNKLKSLRGCPFSIKNYFDCSNNNLSSLEYFPKKVGTYERYDNKMKGNSNGVDCTGNVRKFSKEEIYDVCKIIGSIFL